MEFQGALSDWSPVLCWSPGQYSSGKYSYQALQRWPTLENHVVCAQVIPTMTAVLNIGLYKVNSNSIAMESKPFQYLLVRL